QLSQLDLPGPERLQLGEDQHLSPTSPRDGRDLTATLSGLNLPEPEALSKARAHRRTESKSQDLSEQLSKMNLPQPERIFGPADTASTARGVNADDWEKVQLADDVPEAVKSPTLAHFRRESRSR